MSTNKDKRGNRYTESERRLLLKRYTQLQVSGKSAAQAARELGVARNTFDKWEGWELRPESRQTTKSFEPLNAAILALCNPRSSVALLKRSLLTFIAWRRWPTRVEDIEPLTMCLYCCYHSQQGGKKYLNEFEGEDLSVLLETIRVDYIAEFFTGRLWIPLNADIPEYLGKDYSERDFGSECVSYFIGWGSHGLRPSLAQAYGLNSYIFRSEITASLDRFRSILRTQAASFPFLFIESISGSPSFFVDPDADDFSASIDEMLLRRDALVDYFSECAWATKEFRARLGKRALRHVIWPTFPADLPARSRPFELSPKMKKVAQNWARRAVSR